MQVRRLMEADNMERRRVRRREFNQTVRELAGFVRKRDKRVAAWQAAQAQLRLDRQAAEQQRCVPGIATLFLKAAWPCLLLNCHAVMCVLNTSTQCA